MNLKSKIDSFVSQHRETALNRYEKIQASEARQRFANIVDGTRLSRNRVVVYRHNEPVAAIVSIEDLVRLEALEVLQDEASIDIGFDSKEALSSAKRLNISAKPRKVNPVASGDPGFFGEPRAKMNSAFSQDEGTSYKLEGYRSQVLNQFRGNLKNSLVELDKIENQKDLVAFEEVLVSIAQNTEKSSTELELLEIKALLEKGNISPNLLDHVFQSIKRLVNTKTKIGTGNQERLGGEGV